jgi:hypothetical protein
MVSEPAQDLIQRLIVRTPSESLGCSNEETWTFGTTHTTRH